MHIAEIRQSAKARVEARSLPRQLRCRALEALLQGENIPPSLIDSKARQRTRAQLLNLESAVQQRIGEDPVSARKLYEAIIGNNDALPRRFLSRGDLVASAVGRIVVQQPNGGQLFGTGSLISRHVLITNNHVIDSPESASNGLIQLGYVQARDGDPQPEPQAFRLDPDKFFYTSENLDYTLVGVSDRSGSASTADYGSIELLSASGKALIGECVNVVHHAGGGPQSISIRSNRVVDVFDQWIHFEADTEPGSSGGAVFNDDWELVAIHHAAVPYGNNGGLINEGVRISSILNDLYGGDA